MKKSFLIIYVFSTFVLLTGCTYQEIEEKANEAGNVVGRVIRGTSDGLVEGFSGKEADTKN